MKIVTLNGQWELLQAGKNEPVAATVPGCVHTDLLAAGLLPDLFYRDNELQQKWIGETDFTYRRTFDVAAELLAHDSVRLRCHGLDTIATIRLNGTEIAQTDNMFRTYEFDVKQYLNEGVNSIEIFFAAPFTYAVKMDAEKGEMAGWVEPMRINSGAWIRKEPCNFGWDWGPKMPTSGIWRDIELIGINTARLSDVHILQEHDENGVRLIVKLAAERLDNPTITASVKLLYNGETVTSCDSIAMSGGDAEVTLPVSNPQLWFPNNMGAQPLYDVEISLCDKDGACLDALSKKIGLRSITLERHNDEWGESFYFACNGIPYFAKGANWIPVSPYPGKATAADYEVMVKAAADANMNMLRVWGGGIYEDDVFYDLCDQYGITIWQDFMFACGTYPSFDEDFMANVKVEAEQNVRRIRHHPCLALWCGNNEIEQGLPSPEWKASMSWADYEKLFDGLLADIVRELDPQTAYWPASPHTPCGDRENHSNPDCGDTHLWAVWHGRQPFEWYRTRPDRFCSEFGFQSFPEPRICYEFTEPQDRNITSYVMEHHQRSYIGNSTIIHYMLEWYRLPTTFESMVWLSQILQGMAMKYAVEHWRRNMPRTMGTLYWQHNDMWPAPSWASVDWRGNWKALHYMAKRFYAPVIVSGLEDTTANTIAIHVTSDSGEILNGTIIWKVTDSAGTELGTDEVSAKIAPRANTHIDTLDVSEFVAANGVRDVLVWLELHVGDTLVSENLVLLSRPKHMTLCNPAIHADVQETNGGFDVTLTAQHPALYTWLELEQAASYSDNFVDLQSGQSRTIHVTPSVPMSKDVFSKSLKVQSLYDTFQQ
jgi:beta-mannosidase